ncbi:hypothetical protein QE152_g9911 [Popillia japonica]|uniref:Uncharacterized protein n=1 Tax=Popillia japonica TaxID=7064 RepID=A0AAW1LTE6_POPJA
METDFLLSAVTSRSNPTTPEASPQREISTRCHISENLPPTSTTNTNVVTIDTIRGYSKASARKTNRKPIKKGRGTVITATPEKELIEKRMKRSARRRSS